MDAQETRDKALIFSFSSTKKNASLTILQQFGGNALAQNPIEFMNQSI
jgi:hypothetical protein